MWEAVGMRAQQYYCQVPLLRYSYFSQTVKYIHTMLATSEVMAASPDVNADLFHGARGSAGTLGIITLLDIGLVPAKRFVKLTYHRHSTVDSTIAAVRAATEAAGASANGYVDAILFSPHLGVVMIGVGTDEAPPPSVRPRTFSGPWHPWFYLHAQHQATLSSSSHQSTASPWRNTSASGPARWLEGVTIVGGMGVRLGGGWEGMGGKGEGKGVSVLGNVGNPRHYRQAAGEFANCHLPEYHNSDNDLLEISSVIDSNLNQNT